MDDNLWSIMGHRGCGLVMDLNGTLAPESNSVLDKEMLGLICEISRRLPTAVLTSWPLSKVLPSFYEKGTAEECRDILFIGLGDRQMKKGADSLITPLPLLRDTRPGPEVHEMGQDDLNLLAGALREEGQSLTVRRGKIGGRIRLRSRTIPPISQITRDEIWRLGFQINANPRKGTLAVCWDDSRTSKRAGMKFLLERQELAAVIFVGDSSTDYAAARYLKIEEPCPSFIGVVQQPITPQPLLALADTILPGLEGTRQFLRQVLRILSNTR